MKNLLNPLFRSCVKQCFNLLIFFSTSSLFSNVSCSIDHAIMSVYAVQCENGKVLLDENSELSMIPASCMKIVTTGAALHLLGANSRLETQLQYDGAIDEKKVLQGNIYIKGGGDPCLGSNRIPGNRSWQKVIKAWADEIQKLGIQKIRGKVIADASKWKNALAVPSWTWEDLGNYYGAGASALSFHENFYSLFFRPGSKIGENVSIIRTDPPLPSHVFQNEVKTGPEGSGDRACIYGSEFSNLQFVRGTIPLGVPEFSIKGAIPDPGALCAELLVQELQRRNIDVEQQEIAPLSKRVSFHMTISPTIAEIVHWTNQKSINHYAEHLLKRMGEVVCGDGSTESGIKAVIHFWKSQKISLSGFNMADGSGLSRKNLVTTKQLVEILLKMKKSDFFPVFLESLPQREGLMRAKDGYMSLIHGFAGYTGNIAFAILVNQCADNHLMKEKVKGVLSHLNLETAVENNSP